MNLLLTLTLLGGLPLSSGLGTGITGCPPLNLPNQPTTSEAPVGGAPWVQFQLQPGLLRPQLEQLLRRHWAVDNIVWYAADGHYWPTNFTLQAQGWDELLKQLLAPYRLQVSLHSNHTAVVQNLPEGPGI